MNQYKKLIVWQKAMDLTTTIYSLTSLLPRTEIFGLRFQLNKAAVSVASNISEGASRDSNKEFRHFLSIALGSCNEIDTQLLMCTNLKFLKTDQIVNATNQIIEIQKMIRALKDKLKNPDKKKKVEKVESLLSKD